MNIQEDIYVMIVFGILIIGMLALDLGVLNKRPHKVSMKEALIWSAIWISIGISFSFVIKYYTHAEVESVGNPSSEYITAFLIEKMLSMDNLFVFILIFGYFKVDEKLHHKVLFWGIIGAIITRGIFIFAGVQLISLTYLPIFELFGMPIHLNVVLIVFGGFLLYHGISAFVKKDETTDISKSFAVRIAKKIIPFSNKYDGDKFFTIENGKKVATLLFFVVCIIEITDIAFAIDSIPAIFSVSKDPFILYTSNIFAILGLRTLYFLLLNLMNIFVYLKYGLGFILMFIGAKMFISMGPEKYHIQAEYSTFIILSILVILILASIVFPKKNKEEVS